MSSNKTLQQKINFLALLTITALERSADESPNPGLDLAIELVRQDLLRELGSAAQKTEESV